MIKKVIVTILISNSLFGQISGYSSIGLSFEKKQKIGSGILTFIDFKNKSLNYSFGFGSKTTFTSNEISLNNSTFQINYFAQIIPITLGIGRTIEFKKINFKPNLYVGGAHINSLVPKKVYIISNSNPDIPLNYNIQYARFLYEDKIKRWALQGGVGLNFEYNCKNKITVGFINQLSFSKNQLGYFLGPSINYKIKSH